MRIQQVFTLAGLAEAQQKLAIGGVAGMTGGGGSQRGREREGERQRERQREREREREKGREAVPPLR